LGERYNKLDIVEKSYSNIPSRVDKDLRGISASNKNLRQQQRKETVENIRAKVRTGFTKVDTGLSVLSQKIGQELGRLSKQKMVNRKILKNSQMIVHVPNRKVEDVLTDPNRFFKNELTNERRNMFFQ
jgi:hypothetical protein